MKKIGALVAGSVVLALGTTVTSCGSFSSGGTGSLGSGGASAATTSGGSMDGTSGSGPNGGSGGSGTGVSSGGSVNSAGASGSGNGAGTGNPGNSAGASGSPCAVGNVDCSGTCVDPTTNNANCGSCGHACGTDQTCQSGSCACSANRVLCGTSSACIDTGTDPANCGGCGKACATGQVCSGGACTTTCTSGQTACSGACVNLSTSIDHCGACTTACSTANGQTCSAGSCQCTSGLTSCTNVCKNLQTDAANCGTCGNACPSGQSCSSGACVCGTGLTSCSGSCKNLQTDTANCGKCGTACTTGQTCTNGACSGGATAICDVLAAAGNPCVAAHSTTRLLYSTYTGPLYQVCRGSFVAGTNSCSSGMTKDIGALGGYADSASQDQFCSGSSCTISIIYDQSPNANHLTPAPAGGAKTTADNPANATDLKTTLNSHPVYGVLIKLGVGYRKLVAKGTATGDQAESMYMVSSQQNLINGCCFDYGNAETDAHDDGNGTMEAVYLGLGVIWGTGVNGGPWVEADLENGLYAGWENNQDKNISTNTPLKYDFITAVVVGDVAAQNAGKGRFALYGGDATTGALKTMYDGIRPNKTGYVPMHKQGSIILGIGGDNSDSDGGRWYEGVMTSGAWTLATVNAVQANIVAARYGK